MSDSTKRATSSYAEADPKLYAFLDWMEQQDPDYAKAFLTVDTWPGELRSMAVTLWGKELQSFGLALQNFGERGQGLVTRTSRREAEKICDATNLLFTSKASLTNCLRASPNEYFADSVPR